MYLLFLRVFNLKLAGDNHEKHTKVTQVFIQSNSPSNTSNFLISLRCVTYYSTLTVTSLIDTTTFPNR